MPVTRARRSKPEAPAAAPLLYVAEPGPLYRMAVPMVVDCSLIAAILFQEEVRSLAAERIDGHALHAPGLLAYEIVNVAARKSRAGWGAVARDGVARYVQAPIELHVVNPIEVLDLAERYKLSAYDASYLWLAGVLKAPLATFDGKLGEAARKHLGALE